VPEAGARGAGAGEKEDVVAVDVQACGRERGSTTVVAELANRKEGVGGEPGKDVGLASGGQEAREIERRRVAGVENGAVWDADRKAGPRRFAVGMRAGNGNVMAGAAGVGNGRGVETRRGGDYG